MGMFGIIKIDMPCPNCGKKVEWQTKGLWLKYKSYEFFIGDYNVELDENMSGEMHTFCMKEIGGCGKFIDCDIVNGKIKNTKIRQSPKLKQ